MRVPGRKGSVHDHADAWVLYGVLDGTESLERYDRIDDGSRPGYAEIRLASVTTGTQGKVDLVPPHAIHAEQGGPARSVAIIVRSKKLGEGTVLQSRYDPKTKTRTEGYGPTQVPYDWSGRPAGLPAGAPDRPPPRYCVAGSFARQALGAPRPIWYRNRPAKTVPA